MLRALEPGDRPAWMQLWEAYLAFYDTVLAEEVYDSTWSRLLNVDEPTWGALALQDGRAVGLVHWIFHRTNWSIPIPVTCRTCLWRSRRAARAMRGS